jgi:hypothetical protein
MVTRVLPENKTVVVAKILLVSWFGGVPLMPVKIAVLGVSLTTFLPATPT